MVISKEELEVLSDGNIDVFKRNIIDRCMDRLQSEKLACLKMFVLHNLLHIIIKRVHLKIITSQRFLKKASKTRTLILPYDFQKTCLREVS